LDVSSIEEAATETVHARQTKGIGGLNANVIHVQCGYIGERD